MLQPRGTWEYEISVVNLGENLFVYHSPTARSLKKCFFQFSCLQVTFIHGSTDFHMTNLSLPGSCVVFLGYL